VTIDHVKMWCLQMAIQVTSTPEDALDAADAFYDFIAVPEEPSDGDRVH
jgi:hypothetical protein